jgi:hypothetical protein
MRRASRSVVQGTARTTVPERSRRRSEAGDTLVEVLLALIVLGMASIALLIAFSTSIAASAEHRKLATYDTVLATASQEAIAAIQSQSTLFQNACTTPITSYPGYGSAGFLLPAPYAGVYNVQYVTTNPVQYWNGTAFQPTPCYDNEPQLITIGITGTPYTNSFVVNYPVGSSGSISGSATAQRLVFLNTVVGNYAGSPFSTQPIVEIETNAPNSPVTTDLSPVILSITSGGATLSGCTGNEILGVVTFSGCTINPGGSYQITAQDGNLTPATSNTFTVAPSTYHLVFTTQPVAGISGSTFTTQPVVSVENAQNSVDTAWSGTITLTLSGGALSNCPGSTATSDTLQVTNGAATLPIPAQCDFSGGYFYNAARNPPTTATQYTMTATANPTAPTDAAVPSQSQTFAVTGSGNAAQLAFITQPTGVASASQSAVFTGQPAVAVEDAFGNVVTSAAVSVSLAVNSGGQGETLSGCTASPSNGIYSFSGCYGNVYATNLTLTASSSGLTSQTSNPFNITNVPYSLSFTTSPTAGASGSTFVVQPVLVVKDISGRVVTSTTATIAFQASPLSGTLASCTGLAPNLGYYYVANCTFAGLVGTPYTLTARTSTLTSLPSSSFSPTAPGLASQLVFTTQPIAGASGAAFTVQPVVKVEDSAGNVVTSSTASIILSPTGGTLSSCTGLTAAAGVVNVSNCTFAGVIGQPYTLTAMSGSVTSLPSSSFSPTGPGVTSQVVLGGCSSNIVSLTTCTATATIEDANANVETVDNSSIITFSQLSGSGTVTGLSGVRASGGAASITITGANIGPVTIGANADSLNSNSLTVTILPIPQTITWAAPGTKTWVVGGTGTFSLAAGSDTSGSTVTFASSTTSVCTVSGTTVTMLTAGTCAITPTAPALGNYALTTGATSYVTINKVTQSVAFYTNGGYGTTTASGSATYSPSGTYQTYAQGSGGGTITFAGTSTGVCTVNSSSGLITFVTAGTCTVTADAATTTSYLDSGPTTFTLTTATAAQGSLTITSTSATYNGSAYSLALTTSGGSGTGAVTFTTTSGTASTCAISGSTLTAASSGTCTVTATKAADTNYLVVSSAPTTVTFNRAAQGSLTITSTSATYNGSAYSLALTTSGGSGTGAVTFTTTSGTASTCAISGSTLTAASSGTCTVTATKATDTNYLVVSSAATTVTFNRATQSVAFYTNGGYGTTTASGSATYSPSGTYQTYAKGSGGGTITFAGTSTGVCTVNSSSGLITFVTAGTCTVTADAATTTNYLDSGTTTFTLTINKIVQSVAFYTNGSYGTTTASGSATFNASGSTYQTYAQGSGGGTITFAGTSTGVCTVNSSSGLITFVTAGTCTVTADAATTTNYLDSGTTTFTLTISKGSQSVAFYTSGTYTTTTTSNSASYSPSGTYQTYAQGSAQGTISFTSTTTGVCTVNSSSGLITFVTAGTCTVTADAATTTNYLDSGPTTFTLTITLTSAPQFVSSSTAGGGTPSGNNLTLPVPTGISAGDLLIAVLYTGDPTGSGGDPTTVVMPTGWTLLPNATSPAAEPLGAILTAYHVATASEPASYIFNSGNFNNVTAVMLAYVNSDGTTPLVDQSSWNTTMTSSVLTPSTAADTLVTVYGDYNGASLSATSPTVQRTFVGDIPYASTLAADQYLTSAAPVPGITASGNSGQGTSVTILLEY